MIASLINRRKSTRVFEPDREINNEKLQEMIMCALQAPSAHNRQPWYYAIVKGESKKKLVASMSEVLHGCQERKINPENINLLKRTIRIISNASAVLLVYNNFEGINSYDAQKIQGQNSVEDYKTGNYNTIWLNDILSIGISMENLVLAATELGLDSLYLGYILLFEKAVYQCLQTDKKLVSAIALGYGVEQANSPGRKTMSEITCSCYCRISRRNNRNGSVYNRISD